MRLTYKWRRGSGTIGNFGVYGRIRFYNGGQIVGYAPIGEGIQMVTGDWQQRIYETYISEGIDSACANFSINYQLDCRTILQIVLATCKVAL